MSFASLERLARSTEANSHTRVLAKSSCNEDSSPGASCRRPSNSQSRACQQLFLDRRARVDLQTQLRSGRKRLVAFHERVPDTARLRSMLGAEQHETACRKANRTTS